MASRHVDDILSRVSNRRSPVKIGWIVWAVTSIAYLIIALMIGVEACQKTGGPGVLVLIVCLVVAMTWVGWLWMFVYLWALGVQVLRRYSKQVKQQRSGVNLGRVEGND